MKTTIDIKSVAIGLVIGASIFFLTGAGVESMLVNDHVQRYQVSVGVDAAVVVDTMTGKCWIRSKSNGMNWGNDPEFFDVKDPANLLNTNRRQ